MVRQHGGKWWVGLLVLVGLMMPGVAWGQGFLVIIDPDRPIRMPRPMPTPVVQQDCYKIKELGIRAKVVDQVAQVQVSQTFVNTGSRQMEVKFMFPLPYDGAIDQLTLLVDGKEYPAKLMNKKEARSIYEEIVRRNQDPALLEWMGTGMFQTSVFPVPAGAERTVTLRYNQLLRKDHQVTDFLCPLSTAKYTTHAVEKVELRVSIESAIPIKNVYSPSHAVEIERPDDHHAVVKHTMKNQVPTTDFRLFYDVEKGKVGAAVLSYRPKQGEDGYFLLLASPQIKAPEGADKVKKTVVFVVDRSGSMSGKKMEQAKAALKHVLNNLQEGDLFNIVAYDSSVESFRPELEKYTSETRKAAQGFVEGIYAGGGTNINGALTSALGHLKDDSRPNYVIFLTDGLPTVGETNEGKIVVSAKQNNKVHARIISFGVGYDVNSRLLDRLVRENFGQSEYVRPDEDIESSVAKLYSKISDPVMTDVTVKLEFDALNTEDGDPINRRYPAQVTDLFAGEQLVISGRYRKSGPIKVTLTGKVGGKTQKLDFPAELRSSSSDESYAFVEKLWAMRRIGAIIDELDLKGTNDELIKELVSLSLQHGILTPYTSFLADDQPNSPRRDMASNFREAGERLKALEEVDGLGGFAQRAEKKELQSATRAATTTAPSASNTASSPPTPASSPTTG